jgi:hypothetical protein
MELKCMSNVCVILREAPQRFGITSDTHNYACFARTTVLYSKCCQSLRNTTPLLGKSHYAL